MSGCQPDSAIFSATWLVAPTRSDVLASPVPEAANLGLIRPPFVYMGAIALGLVVHALWPVRLLPRTVGTPAGAFLVLVAVALFVSAVRTFRAAGTPVPGNLPATTIVRSGPYRFSRNPIYLAFSLFHLGLAFWVNSLGLLITLIPAVALMALVVIPREERYWRRGFPRTTSSTRLRSVAGSRSGGRGTPCPKGHWSRPLCPHRISP